MRISLLKKYRLRQWHLVLFLLIALSCGCSTLECFKTGLSFETSKEHQEFFARLDKIVGDLQAKDVSCFSVSGFPYLRTNRFHIYLAQNTHDDRAKEQWVDWMRHLGLQARKKEILNLPDVSVVSLGFAKNGKPDREGLIKQMELCSNELFKWDKSKTRFYESLLPRLKIPQEYSLTRRIIGLYPVFSIPVIYASDRAHKKFKSINQMVLEDLPKVGDLVRFRPASGQPLNKQEIRLLLEIQITSLENPPWRDSCFILKNYQCFHNSRIRSAKSRSSSFRFAG